MTPQQKSNSPNLFSESITKRKKAPKFKIDDFVRIQDKRGVFSKQSVQQIGAENFLKLKR